MYRIKEILDEKGISAKKLAERMGVTPQYISGIIREKGSASISVLSNIANELNVPMWQLFASPEEVQSKKDGFSLTCPHCGKSIKIKVD